ncbi:MAG TPA: radical SAM protein [Pyrinomonadaceae bacterium]
MRILLVNPKFPETYWSFRHALPFEGKRSVFPPLGLLTVASLLPRDCERRLIDLEVERLKDSHIDWADMIFITGMLAQKESLHEIVRRGKQRGKLIVLGGPYVTSTIEELPYADHIFQGEAETTLPQFFADLERGQAKRIYKAPERPPLAITPVPEFGLVNLKKYSNMSVQYSRGCPFSCEFCDIIEIYGRVPRTKSNQQMLAEFDALKQLGWRGPLFIVDDNFIGNKKNVRLLLPDLIEWQKKNGYPFSLLTEASVNLADDDDLLLAMKDAGFRRVFLGIETPVEESLKEAQKTQNRGNLLDSVRKIQSRGMEVMAGFIVGFDNDPEDIFERQIEFIRESAIPMAMVGMLNALPDTQLWKRLEREGRLLGADATGNNTIATVNFIPKMDVEKLISGYQRIMRTIYKPSEYYRRALESLQRVPQEMPEAHQYHGLKAATSFLRIAFKLGVIDAERREFWRFFLKAVREHQDRMVELLRHAAMAYHFRKLSESHGHT